MLVAYTEMPSKCFVLTAECCCCAAWHFLNSTIIALRCSCNVETAAVLWRTLCCIIFLGWEMDFFALTLSSLFILKL